MNAVEYWTLDYLTSTCFFLLN